MCIIAYKEAGIEVDLEDLQDQWMHNNDGAGLAYYLDDNQLKVIKGIMSVGELYIMLEELKDYSVVYHLRLATHGTVNKLNTHPFELSTVPNKRLNFVTKKGILFHNGIISGFGNKNQSDTGDFVQNVLARIPDKDTQLNVLDLIDSKFILAKDGLFHFIGDFEDVDGILYSNTSWQWYQGYNQHYYSKNKWKNKPTAINNFSDKSIAETLAGTAYDDRDYYEKLSDGYYEGNSELSDSYILEDDEYIYNDLTGELIPKNEDYNDDE